jgi:multidrug efflux pump subunit AcrB
VNVTRWSVERLQVSLTFMIVIVVGGILAYVSLPKAEDPGFAIRKASVVTPFPGASPRRVEELVTSPIEEALQQIPEISKISSTSRSGRSVIVVEIDDTIDDLDPVFADIRDAVEDVQSELPDDALDSITDTNVGTVFGVVLALTGDGFTHGEMTKAAEDLKDRLLQLDDASKVEVFGDQQRRIALRFDHTRLARQGLTPNSLIGVLRTTNVVTPGGEIILGDEILGIEPSGAYGSVEDVEQQVVALPSGELTTLDQLVRVEDGFDTPEDPRAFYDGKEALFVGVSLRKGGNSTEFGAQVREATRTFQAELPLGLEITELNYQPDDVDGKIWAFMSSMIQSVVIVFVAMMIFLGLRTGAVVASLIPAVMCATFLVMYALGIGIDQMSLAALLMSLGMLVDNAIVMAESTMVRVKAGSTTAEAVVATAQELTIPLLVSSLTTCVAFLPVYISPGGASEFVGPIFMVVTISLLASWVLALTTLPVVLVLGLKSDNLTNRRDDTQGTIYATYRRFVLATVRYRWPVVIGSVLILVAGVVAFREVPVAFFPPSEKPAFTVKISLPAGTSSDAAAEAHARIEAFLRDDLAARDAQGGVLHTGTMLGGALPRFTLTYNGPEATPGSMALLVHTTDRAGVEGWAEELERWVEVEIPGATVSANPLVLGPGGAAPVAVQLGSNDEAALFASVEATKAYLREQPGARNVADDWGPRTKRVTVEVDPRRARLAGVTHQDVANSLLTTFSGVEATELREGEEAVPIELIAEGSEEIDLEGLRNLTVFGARPVPLEQVANIDVAWDFGTIRRLDRQRVVEVSADIVEGAAADDIQNGMLSWIDARQAEPGWRGVDATAAGELADSEKANNRLLSTLPVVFLLTILLLMMQFNDVRKTFINLVVLPFAIPGVTLGLLVFDSYFGFITLLAIISLFGILLNNGNILLDRIQIELDEGRQPLDAIVEGCVTRLRPIFLTTTTTVVGLVPLYFGGGPMFEPLAVTLMVGLTFGTVLTLGLVPALYSVVFGVRAS